MPFMNFRKAYGFDPQDDDYQDAGGLPGLLREAMQQQTFQQGSDIGAGANSRQSPYSESYGSQQGLLGRLLELQTKQGIPSGVDDASLAGREAPTVVPVQFRIPLTP